VRTLLLALLMFVLAPLQAVGITGAQDLGFAVVLVIGASIVLSENPIAIVVMWQRSVSQLRQLCFASNSLPLSMSV
jgi:hypothetical protein